MEDLINEQPEQDIEHCATCIHAADSEDICILRKCKYAIAELKDCYEPEQRWIPCEERLPDEYGEYRITWATSASKKRFVGDSEYEITSEWDDEHYRFKGEWLLDDYIKNYPDVKVIAWKPIEEPYRG